MYVLLESAERLKMLMSDVAKRPLLLRRRGKATAWPGGTKNIPVLAFPGGYGEKAKTGMVHIVAVTE